VLRARYLAAEEAVVAKAATFKSAAGNGTTHALNPTAFRVPGVTGEEMRDLYNKRFVKAAPGRAIYEEIKAAPEHGRCPLCGHLPVATLDHHVPKAAFDALTVEPTNLVPACNNCNFAKGDRVGGSADEEPIHPYFDFLDDDPWLTAVVVPSAPAALLFQVSPPSHWTPTLARRVENHFDRFALAPLYSSAAATELSNIRGTLRMLLDVGGQSLGRTLVQQRLVESAASRREARINSWQTAMYTALAADPWFCAGGFNG
jgi:hypothetical protein